MDSDSPLDLDQEWSEHELERMYQQAVEAVDSAQSEVDAELQADHATPVASQVANSSPPQPTPPLHDAAEAGTGARGSRVTPAQVIEAALFVGGNPLTTKNLCSLLRDEFDREFVENAIDTLNARYASERRPYEIRLAAGGYRLGLRAEFESVRNKVFGLGPKEVKLSQETLEVLALVAYHQPIARQKIEELGKENPGPILGQLLRRQLITLERGEGGKDDVTYSTAPRFLQLFGLANLDELPRAEELSFK